MRLDEIAARLNCRLEGPGDLEITGVAGMDEATPNQLTFLANRKYRPKLRTTRAGAVILGLDEPSPGRPALRSDNPYLVFARALELFTPPPKPAAGIHPTAVIAPGVKIGRNPSIGPYVVIEEDVELGDDCVLKSFVVIYRGAKIGNRFLAHAHAVVREHCRLGDNVILQNGAVIGADGFGMARDAGRWIKIPQVGAVRIGDDVEIGANTTIDRGELEDTVIEDGVKLDNQIPVAHNCVIAAHTGIAGCTGISGSVTIGRECMIGGGVGIVGHIAICDRVTISGMTLVAKSITRPGTYTSGLPMMPHAQWLKNAAHLRRLDRIAGRAGRALSGEDRERADDH